MTALVLALVALVFFGYVFKQPAFITVLPNFKGMSLLTACGLALISFALIVPADKNRLLSRLMPRASLGVCIAVLLSYLFAGEDILSPWLAAILFDTPGNVSGRTSIATAIAMALLSLAQHYRLRGHSLKADVCSAVTAVVAGTALLGYAYGVRDLYTVQAFNAIAIHTAASLFFLALATMFTQAEHGWAATVASSGSGGGATRRQLLFTLVPPLAGWLLLHATNASTLGAGMGMALLVVLTVTPLIALILHDGKTLDKLDAERDSKSMLLQTVAIDLAHKLDAQAAELHHQSSERLRAEAAIFNLKKMEAVGQLTGGIAHDFNNLLMVINGNLEILKMRIREEDSNRSYIEKAMGATKKGTKLTSQLLAFSRTQNLDIRPTELISLLRTSRELIGSSLGPRIQILMNLPDAEVWVQTDADQFELALINLAVNARDAMTSGGSLIIEAHWHDAPLPNESSMVAIRVSDTGCGMPADVLVKAVEPFFTTKEHGQGTGLGLPQVYGLARQCGGDLQLNSVPGQGTTVTILLPRAEAPSSTDLNRIDPPSAQLPVEPKRKLLLLIDDDDDVRFILGELCRAVGYDVAEAENGLVGLKQLAEIRPDVAIVDFMMPGMNGAEVAIKAREIRPDLPIIFVSGFSDTVALDAISHAVVLRKPVAIENLVSAIELCTTAATS
jgi:signal transduction histidine kinase/CheY-like chemotaxis protein